MQVGIPLDGSEFDITVRAKLDGASDAARRLFAEAVQDYAIKLAKEVVRQEIDTRNKGARTIEITATHVIDAREVLDPKPPAEPPASTQAIEASAASPAVRRRALTKTEAAVVTAYSLLLSAVGVSANHLHSPLGATFFVTTLLGVAVCASIAWKKRIL